MSIWRFVFTGFTLANLLALIPAIRAEDNANPVYLCSIFKEPEQDGLRFAYSCDGYGWTNVPGLFLKAGVGGGIMRDSSICRGPDGVWHLVWIAARNDNGFGYAHSKDLVHWSEQQFIPALAPDLDGSNTWTPELRYDEREKQFIIYWTTTVPGQYPRDLETSTNHHRIYCTRTRDFQTFTDATANMTFHDGRKPGATFAVTKKELDYLFKVGTQQVAYVRLPWVSPVPPAQIEKRLAAIDAVAKRGPFQPDWASITNDFKAPKWYQDAKFGLFIHWGVYAVPAFGSEWYPREMYVPGSREFNHHLATYGPQAKFGYKDFISQFKAEKFDAAAWAKLFKEAGVKYVVPVAEHHDGFPMYDSDLTDWSAAKMGPKRDLIGEQAKAFRKVGIVFGASSHRAEHWFFFDGGMYFNSDVRDTNTAALYGPAVNKRMAEAQAEPPDQEFLDDWLLRSCEIVDKYRPQVMYFDWWICQPVFQPYLKTFAAYYYNRGVEWHKQVAINFKEWEGISFPRGAGVFDMERGQAAEIQPDFWQTCTSVSRNSWGYVTDQDYKEAGEFIDELVDIVSKNGTLLLNLGPKADGTIPEREQDILRSIGGWLKINGEAIYGTRPWKWFGEGPTRIGGGSFSDQQNPAFTAEDIRFTTKDKTLYAIALAWPEHGKLVVKSLARPASGIMPHGGQIKRVELLGYKGNLQWEQGPDGLSVTLPDKAILEFALTLKIESIGGLW